MRAALRDLGALAEWHGLRSCAAGFVRALRFFRAERIALVHVNTRGWRPAEVLAARAIGIPVVAHFQLTQNEHPPMLRHLAAAVCVSGCVARESLPPGLHKPVVYIPVDVARFERSADLRPAHGLAADELVVSFLGQIRDFKGVADFIAMAKHLDGVRATFLLAGECRGPKKFHGSYTKKAL